AGSLEAFAARVGATPAAADEWRDELEAVRRQLENAGERHDGTLAELRGSLEALGARVESLPVPSEEWRGQIADLAGRLDGLRTDEWRPELAEVAENLRTRVERVEEEVPHTHGGEDQALQSVVWCPLAGLDVMPQRPDEVWA